MKMTERPAPPRCGVGGCVMLPDRIDYNRIDPGIADVVRYFRSCGILTVSSCEGGPGHAHDEPTVMFGFHSLDIMGVRDLVYAQTCKISDNFSLSIELDSELTGPAQRTCTGRFRLRIWDLNLDRVRAVLKADT